MKNKFVVISMFIFSVFLFIESLPAQSISDHKIIFKQVLEFSDNGEKFYFNYPDNPYNRQMQVDSDGNIYILDANRIMKFAKNGRYISNLVSEGQGPGEVTNLRNFILWDDKITIFNHNTDKIIIKNKNGSLEKEFRITRYLDKFFAFYKKNYYSFNEEIPDLSLNYAKTIDVNWYLSVVSTEGKVKMIEELKFPIKSFMVTKDGYTAEIRIGEMLFTQLKGATFFLSHSTEYEVSLLDLKKKKIIKTFKRDYIRQKAPKEIEKKLNIQGFEFMGKVYRRPPQKYLNDIQQLLIFCNSLWVVTSTVDEKKGVMIDIFNKEFEFTGSFYLKLSDRIKYLDYYFFHVYISGNNLYNIERDKEDNPWVVKYEIIIK